MIMPAKSALAALLLLAAPSSIWAAPCDDGSATRFEDYPASPAVIEKRAELKLNSAFARKYRTVLREGLRDYPIEFAGRYVVVTFGCGTTCMFGSWVDAQTGEAFGMPHMLDSFGPFGIEDPLLYRIDSRLVITLGAARGDETLPEASYYEWTGARLKPICTRILTNEEAESLGEGILDKRGSVSGSLQSR